MARELKSIPSTLTGIAPELSRILAPIIHNMEVRFLRRSNNELVVTRQQLLDLNLVTQEQLDNLEN